MISGHDTNVANLGGLLDVHWHVPGLAADDPVPGGGLVLTRLHDGQGRLYVRVAYRSQTLGQIRSGADPAVEKPYEVALSPPGCSAIRISTLAGQPNCCNCTSPISSLPRSLRSLARSAGPDFS